MTPAGRFASSRACHEHEHELGPFRGGTMGRRMSRPGITGGCFPTSFISFSPLLFIGQNAVGKVRRDGNSGRARHLDPMPAIAYFTNRDPWPSKESDHARQRTLWARMAGSSRMIP